MPDFIEVDYSKMNIKQLINQLDKLDKHAVNQIMPEVMQAVGNELLQEEKRILSGGRTQTGKPFKFADKLSVMTEHTGKLWRVKAGYSTEVINSNIEVLITEFGRPGKKARKKGGKDSKGRTIGVVQPYPHIRAALINKKEQVLKLAEKMLLERIEREWQKN